MRDDLTTHGSDARLPAARRHGSERRSLITVVLADEEALIRASVARTLTNHGLDVVGETGDAADAVGLVVDRCPDVVLMGLDLEGMSGIETIAHLGMVAPASRILVLTRHTDSRVVEAIVAGASGYILKTLGPDAIAAAVRATAGGQSVLSSKVAGQILERIRDRDVDSTEGSRTAAHAVRAVLTARELEIFRRLASGETNQQIGRELALSTNTVSNHVASILAKLHLENRVQAAVHAVRSGIS